MAEGTVERKHNGWHPPEEFPDSTSPVKDSILRFLEFVKNTSSYEVPEPEGGSTPGKTRAFVPYNLLRAYLKQQGYKELRSISRELFLTREEETSLLGDSSSADIVTRYSAIFGILLSINRGLYIHDFIKSGIDDTQLPVKLNAPPTNLQWAFSQPGFLRSFCKKQWQFCAPVFENTSMDAHFEDDRILPITSRQRLEGGGNATKWKIDLHSSYNKLLSEEARIARGEAEADTFILKTYCGEGAEAYYQSEVEAFKSLGSNPSIIPFYGGFTRAGTYNVILEHADKGTWKTSFNENPRQQRVMAS